MTVIFVLGRLTPGLRALMAGSFQLVIFLRKMSAAVFPSSLSPFWTGAAKVEPAPLGVALTVLALDEPDELVLELLLLLPQAATPIARTAAATAARTVRGFTWSSSP